MQLVSYGAQDIYLTGNPQITFFKLVYRRHTNFSMESIQQTWLGKVGFGETVSATISRNGDLMSRMYLECHAKCETGVSSGNHLTANPGSAMIKTVELEIGGQTIDKHYGHSMEAWAMLSQMNETGRLATMIASKDTTLENGADTINGTTFQSMSLMGGVHGHLGGTSLHNLGHHIGKFWVPLQFWFCNNPGLALPLIALQYHEVKLRISFCDSGNFITPTHTGLVLYSDLWVDYIYLDTDERRRFAQVSHEYLIEQLQFQNEPSDTATTYLLKFNHPVKEIIWAGRPHDHNEDNIGETTYKTVQGVSTHTTLRGKTYKLRMNGNDRFAERDVKYFTRTQVWQHHPMGSGGHEMINQNTRDDSIAVYSFALKPEEHQPSGTCNFSRIDKVELVATNAQTYTDTQPEVVDSSTNNKPLSGIHIYARNYNILRIVAGMGGLAFSN